MTSAIRRILSCLALAASLGFVALSVVATMGASGARGHEAPSGWAYEPFCCNGDNHFGDCQRISADRVRITPEGFLVEIRPGDHRLATVHHLFRFETGKQRRSQDGDYHLCLFPDEHTPRCFYAPDMSF